VIADALKGSKTHEIVGVVADDYPAGGQVCGYPVLGTIQDVVEIARLRRLDCLIAAVGDNWSRAEVVGRVTELLPDCPWLSVCHASAVVSSCVELGCGSVVMAGAVISVGARIGKHCIVNTKASVDHDCVLGDFSSVGPGAEIGGGTNIGAFSAVCIGATVLHNITVGAHTIIGAGAVVTRDVDDFVVAYGVPARVIRSRDRHSRYL
jgi:sugar O-acyltransferase (sialic acid O-acetyltransferase NeuD family)